MLITYNTPNRSSHHAYAAAMARAGCLRAFVTGFSRFSPRAKVPELGPLLVRADQVQNIFIAAQKLNLPVALTDELAYLSRGWIDRQSYRYARESDIFLFYSGTGLYTMERLKASPVKCVVEAVTSHVLFQERILREEYERIKIPFRPFHRRDVTRRVREYEKADAVLCPSEFVKRSFMERGVEEQRIFKVPYGFTPPRQTPRPKSKADPFRVLYVGQISVRKGLRYLLEAFRLLKHPGKELWIVGPVANESGIDDLTLPDGVKFLGVLKGQELENAYQSSRVFVLPTVEDGFGLVLGEALSFGLPIIATANCGGSDLFVDGVEGFVVPIRAPREIAARLRQLADDPELYEKMSSAAVARSHRLGGWDVTGEMLLKAMHTVNGSPNE